MLRVYVGASALLSLSCLLQAQQWSVVVLHPPEAMRSEAHAIASGVQVGTCGFAAGGNLGGVWQGSASSWVPLPVQGTNSYASGVDGPWRCGAANLHAALWHAPSGSMADLHPSGSSGAISSLANKVKGDVQVGAIGLLFDISHAALWRGTAESFVDLHPAGAAQSVALATDGVLQGGAVKWTNKFRAAIWNGTAESVVDIGPNLLSSQVEDMAPGVQVGWWHQTSAARAALWRGTPESFVDMTPPWASSARLYGTTGRVHVGTMPQQNLARAAINFGTPDAWLGLHQFLPTPYLGFSRAYAVYQEGPTIFVGGYAENVSTTYHEAILWIGADPCYANCDSSTIAPMLNVSDFGCFLQRFAAGDPYANCDGSTMSPKLNVADFACFLQRFAAGCQ